MNVSIKIKPLSVNTAWQGKRFKTNTYKNYEKKLLFLLPEMILPEGRLFVYYEFGFSSGSADIDNPIKPFQDILQKKYGFDDSCIYEMRIKKQKVKKGEEYIKFKILPLLENN